MAAIMTQHARQLHSIVIVIKASCCAGVQTEIACTRMRVWLAPLDTMIYMYALTHNALWVAVTTPETNRVSLEHLSI